MKKTSKYSHRYQSRVHVSKGQTWENPNDSDSAITITGVTPGQDVQYSWNNGSSKHAVIPWDAWLKKSSLGLPNHIRSVTGRQYE